MITTDNVLPDWISRQATFGRNVFVDGERTDENAFWYYLALCSPQIFESYAIVLSPFWINWKVKELIESGLIVTEEQTDDIDFKRLSWQQFFKIYNKNFDLNTAYQTEIEIKQQIHLAEWPVYLWFPGEGNCETPELNFIINQIKDLYGDTLANYYYGLLKTKKWETEIIYRGKLSEIEELKNKTDIIENPTAIYPDNKEWCIVTDIDLPFTYIGGTKELIERITTNNEFDIFKIEPRFKEIQS